MERERGYTLIEVLIAAGIAFVAGWQLLAFAAAMAGGSHRLDAQLRARAAADLLEERLTADAATAWSIFAPRRALDGSDNADGHELDFVTEDASRRTFWWAYAYQASRSRVVTYAYVPGHVPVAGAIYDGIASFAASMHPVTDVVRPGNDAYDPLFAGAHATPAEVRFGWDPQASGGNRLVAVRYTATALVRRLLLASGTAPTTFTVVVQYTPAPPTPTP